MCLLPTRVMTDRFNNAILKKNVSGAENVTANDYLDCRIDDKVSKAEAAL